jgi:hypothetical protein
LLTRSRHQLQELKESSCKFQPFRDHSET